MTLKLKLSSGKEIEITREELDEILNLNISGVLYFPRYPTYPMYPDPWITQPITITCNPSNGSPK